MRFGIGCWPILGWRLPGVAIRRCSRAGNDWWKGFISIRDMVRMAPSWAGSSTSIACSPSEWCGWSTARARSAWWFHRRSTPMRARRASASSICSRRGSSDVCRSKTGMSLFDIHARFKFALVVARRPGPTQTVRCSFYLTDFAQIDEPERAMDYDMAFIAVSGGAYATLLELRDREDVALARRMFVGRRKFGGWTDDAGDFSQQGNPHDRRCRPLHVDFSHSADAHRSTEP